VVAAEVLWWCVHPLAQLLVVSEVEAIHDRGWEPDFELELELEVELELELAPDPALAFESPHPMEEEATGD